MQTRATWSDKEGRTHILRTEDVLVVAPYNAQVAALAERLPLGTRVGTVDKFQGQEAAGRVLLDGNIDARRCAQRNGLSVQS